MTRIFAGMLFAMALCLMAPPARAALTLTYAIDNHTIAPAGGTDLMQVFCPSGTVLVSGGWDTSPAEGKFLMVWVSRQVGNSWRIMTVNKHPTAFLGIKGYAVCAFGISGLSSASVSGSANVPAFSTGSGSTFCNGGLPTGGGFDSNFPDPAKLIPIQTNPTSLGWWTSVEYNSTNQAKTFTVYMTCTRNLNSSFYVRSGFQVTIPGNSWNTSSAECDPGDFAIGGGHSTWVNSSTPAVSFQKVRTFGNLPVTTNPRQWTAKAFNANTSDLAFLTPYAQCLHPN